MPLAQAQPYYRSRSRRIRDRVARGRSRRAMGASGRNGRRLATPVAEPKPN